MSESEDATSIFDSDVPVDFEIDLESTSRIPTCVSSLEGEFKSTSSPGIVRVVTTQQTCWRGSEGLEVG